MQGKHSSVWVEQPCCQACASPTDSEQVSKDKSAGQATMPKELLARVSVCVHRCAMLSAVALASNAQMLDNQRIDVQC
jgi:hypothetical protein